MASSASAWESSFSCELCIQNPSLHKTVPLKFDWWRAKVAFSELLLEPIQQKPGSFKTVLLWRQWHLVCQIVHQALAGHCSKQSASRAGERAIFLTHDSIFWRWKPLKKGWTSRPLILAYSISIILALSSASSTLEVCSTGSLWIYSFAAKSDPFQASRNSDSTAGFTAAGRGFAKKGGRGSWIRGQCITKNYWKHLKAQSLA